MPSIIREAQIARLTTSDIQKRVEKLTESRAEYTDKLTSYEPWKARILEDNKKIKLYTVYTDNSFNSFGWDPVRVSRIGPKYNHAKFATMADHAESLRDIKKHEKKYNTSIKCVDRHLADYNRELERR